MFGSLRLELDQDDPVDAFKKKQMKIFQKPSITEEYLSKRTFALTLESLNNDKMVKARNSKSVHKLSPMNRGL